MHESDMVPSQGDVMRRLADLERTVREMRAERRLGAATIEAGTLRVVDVNGTVVAVLGNLNEVVPDRYGFWLGRPGPSPSQAISVYGTGEGGDQGFVGMWDREGTYIVTDDAQSGRGLARPYLGFTMGELTVPPTTTSGTFSDLAMGMGPLHHPVLWGLVLTYSSSGTTTGEVRLTADGTPVGPTLSVAGGEFLIRDLGPFLLAPYLSPMPGYGSIPTFAVQARRTAGTGSIGVRMLSLLGVESSWVP